MKTLPPQYRAYLDSQSGVKPFALQESLCGDSARTIGKTTYVTHKVTDLNEGRRKADSICEHAMLPVYFGTGYAVNVPHIQRLDYGCELVLRFFPAGEDRSGSADDYTTVHTFAVTARAWPTEKQLIEESAALEASR